MGLYLANYGKDITSYKIQSLNPVTVKESVAGDGKMCGAIFVDEQFLAFLRGRLKRWDKLKPEQVRRIMENDWEHGIKRGFTDGEGSFNIELPAEATGGLISRNKSSRFELKRYAHRFRFELNLKSQGYGSEYF